ncbi:sodium-driven chloride bicarbonate exchanger-like isoform X2 [Daphnia carinata]|uniref:sodium-driven chloride bicarbonate exchanger-like isoform X2 n=1 Tax=Daphnia carinata TaxID=120202 RepID=UPI0028688987|nr:sodium-driven chloride bicarbonate exchanger-like isoform X2 [Daphnia carinata]
MDESPLPVPRTGAGDAPKDPGIASNCHQSYTEKDYEGHRAHTMYVGVHVPSSGNKRRSSHHRRHRHHHRHQHQPGIAEEASPADNSAIPPSQRVQFILGEEADGDDGTHESHPLFSEMEELCYNHDAGEVEWNETARWVKFEEDVEEGGSRWSKPHVATLSLHSLFELRSLLLNGPVLLDADAQTLVQITDLTIDMMANSGHLPFNAKDRVREALLRRHRHLYEKNKEQNSAAKLPIIRSLADIGRNYSTSRSSLLMDESMTSMTPIKVTLTAADSHDGNDILLLEHLVPVASNFRHHQSDKPDKPFLALPSDRRASWAGTASQSHANMAASPSAASMLRNASEKDMGNGDVHKGNTSFLKKIPPGAEASNVLVGEVDCLEKPVSAFIRLVQPVVLGDLTEVPVPTRFIFILLGPVGGQASYHEVGRAMATLMSDEVFHEVAYRAKNRDHLLAGIDEFMDAVTILPPGEWDPQIRIEPPAAIPSQSMRKFPEKNKEEVNEEEEESKVRETSGLYRTGRLFGGLINDVKRKLPWYWSDYKDAMSIQCLAAFTFLYFACLTPLITFGGLLGDATENRLGTMESLCSGFLCGIIYGIFSGQPLTILGSTGPVLVFENILYDFCKKYELDYLGLRFWIGMWIALILLILVAIDASAIVCYITRFTEENFALLIATIFIYKAIEKVISIGNKYPMNPPVISDCRCLPSNSSVDRDDMSFTWSEISWQECQSVYNGTLEGTDCHLINKPWYPNVFLMSIILCVSTYFLCVTLKNMKRTNFFPNSVRQVISDFGVFITICSMSLMDAMAGVRTPKLIVPDEFKPTWEGRGWVVSPFNNPWWTIPAAVAPAMLATILIFMDQQITAVIVNRRENKLKKGCGYHLDLFVLAILIIIKSIMGLPWFVAATVLSINHVNALKLQTECAAPGEKPQFLGVKEQRVTLIMISTMIGLSVFMTPILTYIPMPVLFGVFLYMGTSPLADMQFYDRLLLLFMPTKYQPDHIYLRKVTLRRVHLFTFIQLLCFILLWAVKEINAISIAFPLMLVVMIGVRKSLDFIFTKYELKVLDDLMPEIHTKHKEEDEDEEAGGTNVAAVSQIQMTDYSSPSGKNFQIQLPNGNIMNIPVDSSTAGGTASGGAKAMNISEEVNRSGVWKTVNIGNVLPASTCIQENKPTCRNNRRREK